MAFSRENRFHTIHGILFVMLSSVTATFIANLPAIKQLGISPLIVGIIIGMIYANTLREHLPDEWVPGLEFSMKSILRIAIIFYGFRITFHSIQDVGISGVLVSVLMVSSTFIIGYILGTKVLKLDRDTTILTSAGSSICGAAAVLATEPVLKSDPYKSTVAVATVVLFGSIGMFLYPVFYNLGLIPLPADGMGLYVGGTLHEVANVVAAGNEIGEETAAVAVIVKMIRVMMIAPFLLILSIFIAKAVKRNSGQSKKTTITIPWFAVLFIVVAGFNSLNWLPEQVVTSINQLDTFALTMAMTAMGMETRTSKFKGVGFKPIYLAMMLFAWLIFGGFYIVKIALTL